MSRKLYLIIFIVILGLASWYFRGDLQKLFRRLPELEQTATHNAVIQNLARNVFAPDPLRSRENYPDSFLARQGVIYWTNTQRAQNGNLPSLIENARLNQAAQAKLTDMFNKQYFEHVSPSGKGPSDLADAAEYAYIVIGENLALGNFKDDQALVEAWMRSPGHRANILNAKYQEIGVAVGKGTFEGKLVWLAVQEFGKPASSCPWVDPVLKQKIESLKADMSAIEPQLQALKEQVDRSNPQTKKEYEAHDEKVSEYNNLVKIYNNKVDLLKQTTNAYNAQVQAYNACVEG